MCNGVVEARDGYTAHVHGHENDTGQKVNKGGICAMTLRDIFERLEYGIELGHLRCTYLPSTGSGGLSGP